MLRWILRTALHSAIDTVQGYLDAPMVARSLAAEVDRLRTELDELDADTERAERWRLRALEIAGHSTPAAKDWTDAYSHRLVDHASDRMSRLITAYERQADRLEAAEAELDAARTAVGQAWLDASATLAEAIVHKTRALERLDSATMAEVLVDELRRKVEP